MKIQEFNISQLFGYQNIKIPIVDNKLILVAENGAGKTNVLRLLYLFLSKQWSKLMDFDFEMISAKINNQYYEFRKSGYEDKEIPVSIINAAVLEFPVYENFIRNELTKFKMHVLLSDDLLINELESNNDVPISMIRSILVQISTFEFKAERFDWDINILYLPTYRRIERSFTDLYGDLDKRLAQYITQLFPQIQTQIQEEKSTNEQSYSETEIDISNIFEKLWRARDYERWNSDHTTSFAMELIEFGMEDVQFRMSQALGNLQLNGDAISKFLTTCNKYLSNHKELYLTSNSIFFGIRSKDTGESLSFSVLSSGEKQILSLFSYFLNQASKILLIIDEPELSLSLTWQESLISDILMFNIDGLIAATHSPFIVTNTLKSITHGLNEFTE